MADLLDLLVKTSRTFALSIPLLPEPTANEVTVAYLLFRIADTFEDAWVWSRERRIQALKEFCKLLHRPDASQATTTAQGWVAEAPPSSHDGYLELLRETPAVMDELTRLSPQSRRLVAGHTLRTAQGMAGFVARSTDEGHLKLRDLPDLRHYCYIVAGIVGEMLTELFLLGSTEARRTASLLRRSARGFGEALQLVNILKDSANDVGEGRSYLPPGVDRGEVFALAREDLSTASQYVLALQEVGAPRGYIAFTALPVELAWATLERVETRGAGAKLTRAEVGEIVQRLDRSLDRNLPAVGVPAAP